MQPTTPWRTQAPRLMPDVMPMNTGSAVLIREARPSDAQELARLRWDSRGEDEPGHSRIEFLNDCETWLREALSSGPWVIAAAESEPNSLCGCMFLQCIPKVPAPGANRRAWGYITNAYVDYRQRSHGIGRKLLDLLIEAARNRKLEFLIVWPSEAAVAFYNRAGFRSVSEVHVGSDDEPPLELMLSVAVGVESPGTA